MAFQTLMLHVLLVKAINALSLPQMGPAIKQLPVKKRKAQSCEVPGTKKEP